MTHKICFRFRSEDPVGPAIGDCFKKLNPRLMVKNPGHVRDRSRRRGDHGGHFHERPARPRLRRSRSPSGSGSPCSSPTSPRPWPKAAARPRPRPCARPARRPSPTACSTATGLKSCDADSLRKGDVVVVRARRNHSRRRRNHRRRGHGGRIGHHRRIGAGHPREPAATAAPSPAAPACSRSDQRSASPPIPAKAFWTA